MITLFIRVYTDCQLVLKILSSYFTNICELKFHNNIIYYKFTRHKIHLHGQYKYALTTNLVIKFNYTVGKKSVTLIMEVVLKKQCCLTWSAHQYQMEDGVCPRRKPGHGMSECMGSLNMIHESWRGTPQVVFGYVSFGTACR
jgi:hypothetical protein